MSCTFQTFDTSNDNGDGTVSFAPSQTLKIWDVTANVASSVTVSSDASGVVAGGTISDVAVGHLVRFRIENDGTGKAGYCEQLTLP